MGLDVDDMPVSQLVSLFNGLQQTLNAINLKLGGGSTGAGGAALVRTQSYDGHLFVQVPTQASTQMESYDLPHAADAVVVTCPFDFQVEFDKDVAPTTPGTASYSLPSFELKVKEKITYKLTDTATNKGKKAPFYVWLFWYE